MEAGAHVQAVAVHVVAARAVVVAVIEAGAAAQEQMLVQGEGAFTAEHVHIRAVVVIPVVITELTVGVREAVVANRRGLLALGLGVDAGQGSRGDRGCHQGLLQHFHVLAFKWSIRMSAIIHLPATLYQYRPRAL